MEIGPNALWANDGVGCAEGWAPCWASTFAIDITTLDKTIYLPPVNLPPGKP
jgi:hypothetical protein